MTQLSEHFSIEEMTFSDTGQRLGLDNTCAGTVLVNLSHTAAKMEEVRTLFNLPIRVTSGYRSPRVNSAVGGSKSSDHMSGLACDFQIHGITNYDVACKIRDSAIDYGQLILEYGWVHIGIGSHNRMELTKHSAASPYQPGIIA